MSWMAGRSDPRDLRDLRDLRDSGDPRGHPPTPQAYRLPAFPGTPSMAPPAPPGSYGQVSYQSSGSPKSIPPMMLPPMSPVTPRDRVLRRPKSMMTLGNSTPNMSRANSRLSHRPSIVDLAVYKGNIHVGVRCKPGPQSSVWTVLGSSNSPSSYDESIGPNDSGVFNGSNTSGLASNGSNGSNGSSGSNDSGSGSNFTGSVANARDSITRIAHSTAGEFAFDAVYDKSTSNGDIFERSVRSLIGKVVEGYNATVFAYGITGSGKTWTMQGGHDPRIGRNDPGIIPRSVDLLYSLMPPGSHVKLSYLEIYNERVYDLLTRSASRNEVTLRDDAAAGQIRTIGLTEVTPRSASDLLRCVADGDQVRRTSSTEFNERSSRSHAVVKIVVTTPSTESILYLCDLAGSERALQETERRREGSFINKSLLALSTVISRLSQGGSGHVPYRDSKLTRLLYPSLSGSALVSVLCTIQTSGETDTETLNTLRFAAKAKNVVVTAKRGSLFEDQHGGTSAAAAATIDQLRQENLRLRVELDASNASREDLQEQLEMYLRARDDSTDASIEQISGISGTLGDDDDDDDVDESHLSRGKSKAVHLKLKRELKSVHSENKKLHAQISELARHISEVSGEVEALSSVSPVTAPTPPSDSISDELEELRESIKDRDEIISYLRVVNNHKAGLGISVNEV